jgi:NAD(P)-dependent dehydrogenase (short-subunit alcohol dehydrogenase family)
MRFVVTGANRGIGLELVRQIVSRGDEVDAAAREPERADALRALAERHPDRIRLYALDVTSDASARALARELAPGPVDIVINNAAIKGQWQSLQELDFEDVWRTLNVNALGAIRVSRALLERMRASGVKKLIAISSDLGSIGDNRNGGAWGYRLSKAALNMAMKNFAVELRPEGFACAVIHPGWVQTDMGGPGAPTPVAESVAGVLRAIDALTVAHTGSYVDWQGGRLPW